MSLVFLTYHDENIEDIEKRVCTEEQFNFPKYVSIHRQKSPPINQIECDGKKLISTSPKYFHKTLGYAEVPLNEPSQFLKKNGGIKWKRLKDHVCPPSKGLPPIPSKAERRQKGVQVNFIKTNIKLVKTATPRKVKPLYVDTPKGDRQNLDGTGLVLKYVVSQKFGKTPAYLKKLRKALKTQEDICEKNSDDSDKGYKVLSDSEKNTILMGLRENLSELDKVYRLLPLYTDTQSKKQRKATLQKELKRLEQDIFLLESNSIIIVCDD